MDKFQVEKEGDKFAVVAGADIQVIIFSTSEYGDAEQLARALNQVLAAYEE